MTPKKFVRTHGPLREDRAGQRDVALEHEREGLHLLRRGRAEVHLSSLVWFGLVWFGLVWLVRVGDCGLSVGGFGMAKHTHTHIYIETRRCQDTDIDTKAHRARHVGGPIEELRARVQQQQQILGALVAFFGWVDLCVYVCVRAG